MRKPRNITVIILTTISLLGIGSPRARAGGNENDESCSVGNSEVPQLDWMKVLNRSIGESLLRKPAEKLPEEDPSPTPEPEAEEKTVNTEENVDNTAKENYVPKDDDDPEPGSEFDMKEPMLGKLTKAVHHQAEMRRKNVHGRWMSGSSHGKGWCYRAVKDALVAAGMVKHRWAESPARKAHESGTLKKLGYIDVKVPPYGYTSANAPIGAILVYNGGPKGAGHIEIRTSRYEYCSDYCAATPLDLKTKYAPAPRKLIGIYVYDKTKH